MKRTRQMMLATVALLIALPVFAQNSRIFSEGGSWVEEITGTVSAPSSLRVTTDTGSINVQGGAQKDVTYTIRKRIRGESEEAARRDLAGFRISAARRGDAAVLEGTTERRYGRLSVDFQVQTPRDLQSVHVSTDGGSVAIRNIAGQTSAESGGGSITLADLAGETSAETGGGSIQVTNSSNLLKLRSGGGSIRITGAKGQVNAGTGGGSISVDGSSQAVTLETGGGSIHVQQCGAELRASTGGGSISVGDVNGRARLETGGGSIHLASARGPVVASTGGGSIELYKLMQGAQAETGAGPITAEFLGMNSDSSLETSVGDVVVYIGPQAKMTIRAELDMANGHKINSEFPELQVSSEGGGYGPRSYRAQGALNGGGPVLRIRAMSGNIDIRRAR